jgi:hypothetical protein
VAIVTHPAYEQTSVGTREAGDAIDKAIEAQLQRECGGGDDEAKKKAEEEAKAEEERKAKAEQEERERQEREAEEARQLEEQAQRFREQQAMRLRARRMRTEQEIESLSY